MSKIDLTSTEWNDLVFEGRNKNYGGYDMRVNSNKRHIIAIIAIFALTLLVVFLPGLVKNMIPERKVEIEDTSVREFEKIEEQEEEEKVEEIKAPPPPPLMSTLKFTAPVITKEPIKEEDELKDVEEIQKTDLRISIIDNEGTDDKNAKDFIEVREIVKEVVDDNRVFETVEQLPEFPGGMQELYKYIQKNIKYPTIALENGITGKVIVRFVVLKSGEIGDVKVLKGLDPACDKEAMRVVKSLPKWIPGKQNGTSVNVYYTLPITFKTT